MNWKEHAHLFKGFEFINHTHIPDFKRKIFSGDDLWLYEKVNGNLRAHKKNDCTLIARKIEDMTDKEKAELRRTMYDGIWRSESFLYALSVWVYPGPQSHFKTGDVIDITTIS